MDEASDVADFIDGQSAILTSVSNLLAEKCTDDPSDIRTINLALEFFCNCTISSKEYTVKVVKETCIFEVMKHVIGGVGEKTINSLVLDNIFNFVHNMTAHEVLPPLDAHEVCL